MSIYQTVGSGLTSLVDNYLHILQAQLVEGTPDNLQY